MTMIGRTSQGVPRRRGEAINQAVAWLLAIAVGAVAWAAFSPSDAMAAWHTSMGDGLSAAGASGRPMLVLYTADWCPACKQLESEVLEDPDVVELLEQGYETVVIDLTDRTGPNARIANEHGIRSIPTVHIYDASGQPIDDRVGGGSAPDYHAWLERSTDKVSH